MQRAVETVDASSERIIRIERALPAGPREVVVADSTARGTHCCPTSEYTPPTEEHGGRADIERGDVI